MKLTVYTRQGSEAGRTVDLDDAVFGVDPNDHAIWLDVRAIQAHKRQGTHKTKERSEVSRSRRKLYRQKGTGNARAGDAKSPLRKGGGTIFGPRPHEYRLRVNRKTRQLARRSALKYKIDGGALRVIENVELAAPKTREIADLLKSNGIAGKALVLTNGLDDVLYRSARNIPGVAVLPADQASTLDLLNAKTVLLQEGAIEVLTEALRPATKATIGGAVSAPAPVAEEPAVEEPAVETPAVEETAEPEAPVADEAPAAEEALASEDAATDAPAEADASPAEDTAEATAEPEAEAATADEDTSEAEAPAEPDDLTTLHGVGPVFAKALAEAGITTFAAVAEADLDALRSAIGTTSGSDASANEETWAEQARFLAGGDQEGFGAYVASLKADSDS